MPFEEVLAGSFGSILKWIGVALMIFAVVYMRGICISKEWLFLAVWFVYCVISGLWAKSDYWWEYFIKIYANQFAFAFILGQMPSEFVELKYAKKGMLAGTILAAGLLIFSPTTSAYIEGRRTIVLWGTHMDPNILAAVFVMGLYALLALKSESKRKGIPFNIMFCLAFAMIVFGIVYTGSRGGLIALMVSLLVLFIMTNKKALKKKRTILILIGACILIICVLLFVPEDYLTSRFSWSNILGINDYKNGAHNRYTIWMRSWELFKRNPIIGYGCGNFFSAIANVYKQCAAHNLVVLSLVEYGVLGSIPLFAFLILTIRKLYRSGNKVAFSMLIAILIISLSLDSLPYKYFWVTIIVSYLEAGRAHKEPGGILYNG